MLLMLSIGISGFIPLFFIVISFSLVALVLLETLYVTEQVVLNKRMSKNDLLGFVFPVMELSYYANIIGEIGRYYDWRLIVLLVIALLDFSLSRGRGSYTARDVDLKTMEDRKIPFLKSLCLAGFLILSNLMIFLLLNLLNHVILILCFIVGLLIIFYSNILKFLVNNSLLLKGMILIASAIILSTPLLNSFIEVKCLSYLLYFVYVLSYAVIWHILSVNFYLISKNMVNRDD